MYILKKTKLGQGVRSKGRVSKVRAGCPKLGQGVRSKGSVSKVRAQYPFCNLHVPLPSVRASLSLSISALSHIPYIPSSLCIYIIFSYTFLYLTLSNTLSLFPPSTFLLLYPMWLQTVLLIFTYNIFSIFFLILFV